MHDWIGNEEMKVGEQTGEDGDDGGGENQIEALVVKQGVIMVRGET